MHRNLLLLLSLLAVLAALIVGVNLGRRFPQPIITPSPLPSPSTTPVPTAISLTNFLSRDCRVSFEYPLNFTKLETSASAVFTDPQNASETVVLTCQKDIPRPVLPLDKIENVVIGTVSAKLYHDISAKNGSPIDELIFRHPATSLDVLLAGFGEAFQQILTSLKVL